MCSINPPKVFQLNGLTLHLPHYRHHTTPHHTNTKTRLDDLDIGFFPVTASEMKVKMKSRQAVYQQTIDPAAQLADTDRFDFCAEINEKAFQWALDRAPPRTKERFGAVGVWPKFDPDIRCV